MGFVTKDIAVITEPKILTLSAAPNFVQFASKPSVKTFLEVDIKINITNAATTIPVKTSLILTEPSGAVHIFHGTTDAAEVSDSVFFVAEAKADTAENLRQCLISNRWINANFEVRIPSTLAGSVLSNGEVINIKSKGAGADFNFTLSAPNNTANVAYLITWINATSLNNDSISGEAGTVEIELDVYDSPAVFLGGNDVPDTVAKIGTKGATLQKTYASVPLWFEINALSAQYGGFNLPAASGWFDTGTVRVYRFAAKVKAANSFAFYQSNALFVLNGYARASENLDLSAYTYNESGFKLLTNKPRTPYVKGQKEYLNFIFQDAQHGVVGAPDYSLRVAYRAYSTSNQYLGVYYGASKLRSAMSIVNTFVLDIDAVLTLYPKAGIVRAAIAKSTAILSNDIEYTIRPESLHELEQVTFLNRLGGWDSFNFDRTKRDEIKPSSETYNKNITPTFKKGDSIETVYSTALDNSLTIEGAPVDDDVAEWLKELAAAKVVLDGNGYYMIKEDFTLNVTAASQNMQVPTLKYRLSETYTND